jgi:hypothetical protein
MRRVWHTRRELDKSLNKLIMPFIAHMSVLTADNHTPFRRTSQVLSHQGSVSHDTGEGEDIDLSCTGSFERLGRLSERGPGGEDVIHDQYNFAHKRCSVGDGKRLADVLAALTPA